MGSWLLFSFVQKYFAVKAIISLYSTVPLIRNKFFLLLFSHSSVYMLRSVFVSVANLWTRFLRTRTRYWQKDFRIVFPTGSHILENYWFFPRYANLWEIQCRSPFVGIWSQSWETWLTSSTPKRKLALFIHKRFGPWIPNIVTLKQKINCYCTQ